ncbi:MAG: hypothetical protein J2P55_10690, partial [Rhizobiales bacterium]|nr:hypothetical protein [Hyphomicrobiales bacterium]
HIYICSQEPVDYPTATSTYALGNQNFGAGNALTGPTNRSGSTGPGGTSPNPGRQVTTVAVTSGTVTGTGTATWWAIVDSVNQRLLVDNALASSQGVTAGNVFSIPAFNFGIPGS